jgi:hypothetical protein
MKFTNLNLIDLNIDFDNKDDLLNNQITQKNIPKNTTPDAILIKNPISQLIICLYKYDTQKKKKSPS